MSAFPEEKPHALATRASFGLYVHVPFCSSKCPYCHFVSIPGGEELFAPYFDALQRELDMKNLSACPETVYIGGGTPSVVDGDLIRSILARTAGKKTVEITVEANPESLREKWLDTVRDAGADRISIGIQSFDDTLLFRLGRIHTAAQAGEAARRARNSGFDNVSIDLIYGIPGQHLGHIRDTLDRVLDLGPSHISWYGLSLEADTEYLERFIRHELDLPDDDLTADMYGLIAETLENNGFQRYEISNFAREGYDCRHNTAYWNYTPYTGIGVSAHSFDGTRRSWNEEDVERYIACVLAGRDPEAGGEDITPTTRLEEHVMLALRTSRGLERSFINGLPVPTSARVQSLIDGYLSLGLMEHTVDGGCKLTVRGAVLADEIISDILTVIA